MNPELFKKARKYQIPNYYLLDEDKLAIEVEKREKKEMGLFSQKPSFSQSFREEENDSHEFEESAPKMMSNPIRAKAPREKPKKRRVESLVAKSEKRTRRKSKIGDELSGIFNPREMGRKAATLSISKKVSIEELKKLNQEFISRWNLTGKHEKEFDEGWYQALQEAFIPKSVSKLSYESEVKKARAKKTATRRKATTPRKSTAKKATTKKTTRKKTTASTTRSRKTTTKKTAAKTTRGRKPAAKKATTTRGRKPAAKKATTTRGRKPAPKKATTTRGRKSTTKKTTTTRGRKSTAKKTTTRARKTTAKRTTRKRR